MDKEKEHDKKVNFISRNPSILNLENIALSTGQSPIFKNDEIVREPFKNDEIVREPDGLMFDPTTHTLYNIEYKTHRSNPSRNRAKKQLRDCNNYLMNIFDNWKIINLYIHDTYKIEVIK